MKKLANFLVNKRKFLFIVSIIVAVVCLFLSTFVMINKDKTKYLAQDSNMNLGLQIINKEFPAIDLKDTFQIMFEGLTPSEKLSIHQQLKKYDGVTDVQYDITSSDYNTKSYTMYIVTTEFTNDSTSVNKIINSIKGDMGDKYVINTYYSGGELDVVDVLVPMALTIMLILLLLMCKSYFEPVLLLVSIAVAVLINMGTNIIFESVSDLTFSIAAVFQLVLSIDYSIILLHRYEQEYDLLGRTNKEQAMKNAIVNAVSSISSSSFTTVAGLMALLLMSFTIGKDIGLVLAKGVILSFICVLTVMPSLILWFDKIVFKTSKKNIKQYMLQKNGGEYNV